MAKAQKIGKLRFRVDLLSKTAVAQGNLSAQFDTDWNTKAQRDADIKPFRGAQFWEDRNNADNLTDEIIIRHEEQFEDRGRVSHIRHKKIMYEVMEVFVVEERGRFIRYMCIKLGDETTYNVV